jgi:LPS-assembly protein
MWSWAGRLVLCLLCTGTAARAAEWPPIDECPTSRMSPFAVRPAPRVTRPATPGPTSLRADTIQSLSSDVIELKGNAEAKRDGEQISANYLRHDNAAHHVDASGDVVLTQPSGARFTTTEAHLDLDPRVGFLDAGTYQLPSNLGRGDMTRAEFLDDDHTRLYNARFTTCPLGREDWAFHARRIDLDTAKDVGVARNTTLDVFGVPVFYLPYFRFPISNERQTGLLVPEFGLDKKNGTIIAVPFYWNIAPDYDATLVPRNMTARGLQLQSEFRYLGHDLSGQLSAEILPNDKQTGENRAAATYTHRQAFNPYWSAAVDLRSVSDKDYLSDFGDRIGVTSESYLPENAEINYRGSAWTFAARAADYQTVDRTIPPSSRPYARLPQLVLAGNSGPTPLGPQYRLDGELVNFQRSASLTGSRVNIGPAVSLPLSKVYGFLTPEAGVRYIAYSLDDTPDSHPSVTAPYLTLDSGLFFEREVGLGDGLFDQTLEPRLYYLYVPHRPQDALPNFDTALPDFTFASLFRNNRFVGGDRVGDANQLTVALTTRLLDQRDGAEKLRASIGRIHYFDERQVNVPPAILGDASSDVAAEALVWLPYNWHARATTQWTPDQTLRSSYYVQHQPAPDKILSIGYRFTRDQLEQADVSAQWPIRGAWTLSGRSLYSMRDNENVESYVGIQYSACCWAVRLYGSRRLVQATAQDGTATSVQRSGIAIQFELTGLSRSNGAFESPLRQGLFFTPPGGQGSNIPTPYK